MRRRPATSGRNYAVATVSCRTPHLIESPTGCHRFRASPPGCWRGWPGRARRPHGARTAPGHCRPHPATARPPDGRRTAPSGPAGPSSRTRPARKPGPAAGPARPPAPVPVAGAARTPVAGRAGAAWWQQGIPPGRGGPARGPRTAEDAPGTTVPGASPEDSTRKAPSGDAQTRKAHIACPETQDMPRLEGWQWLLSGWTSSPPAPQADLRPAGLARADRLQVIPGPGTAAGAGSLPGHSPAPWGQAGDRHAPGADETADGPTRPGGIRPVRFLACWPSGCGATPRMCTEID